MQARVLHACATPPVATGPSFSMACYGGISDGMLPFSGLWILTMPAGINFGLGMHMGAWLRVRSSSLLPGPAARFGHQLLHVPGRPPGAGPAYLLTGGYVSLGAAQRAAFTHSDARSDVWLVQPCTDAMAGVDNVQLWSQVMVANAPSAMLPAGSDMLGAVLLSSQVGQHQGLLGGVVAGIWPISPRPSPPLC